MEDAILEAAEQKFGSKQDYAKTLGNWARGIQNKFIDGFILRPAGGHTHQNPAIEGGTGKINRRGIAVVS